MLSDFRLVPEGREGKELSLTFKFSEKVSANNIALLNPKDLSSLPFNGGGIGELNKLRTLFFISQI